MEELNELEQQEMEVENTEEPIDEYDIEEVGPVSYTHLV